MPDISEYYSGGSTLEAQDVDEDRDYTVTAWRKKVWDDGNATYYLKLEGEDKELRVNKTNARRIAEVFGNDIDDWVGKTVRLFPDVVPTGKHQGKSTITIRARKTARPKPAPKKQYDDLNPPPPLDDEVPF